MQTRSKLKCQQSIPGVHLGFTGQGIVRDECREEQFSKHTAHCADVPTPVSIIKPGTPRKRARREPPAPLSPGILASDILSTVPSAISQLQNFASPAGMLMMEEGQASSSSRKHTMTHAARPSYLGEVPAAAGMAASVAPGLSSLQTGQPSAGAATAAMVCPRPAGSLVLDSMDALQAAADHLARVEPALVPLIQEHGPPTRLLCKMALPHSNTSPATSPIELIPSALPPAQPQHDHQQSLLLGAAAGLQGAQRLGCFATLAKSIIFQQLAIKAAATIHARFLAACKCVDDYALTPEMVLATGLPELRASGLSERKASYIRSLAEHFASGILSDNLIATLDDSGLVEALTKVRGIGTWTVHMFALFHLGHSNVLPVGDLGVRKGMQTLFRLKELPSAAEMEKLTAKWEPYRSVGCFYMWRIPTTALSKKARSAKKSQ